MSVAARVRVGSRVKGSGRLGVRLRVRVPRTPLSVSRRRSLVPSACGRAGARARVRVRARAMVMVMVRVRVRSLVPSACVVSRGAVSSTSWFTLG